MDENVTCRVQFALPDVLNAYLDCYWKQKHRPIQAVFAAAFVPAGLMFPSVWFLSIIGIIVLGLILWLRIWIQQAAKTTFATPAFSSPVTVSMNQDGYSARSEAVNTTVNWSQFTQWLETDSSLLLFMSPALFMIVPKRFLSEPELNLSRQLVQGKVQPAKPDKPYRLKLVILFVIACAVAFVAGIEGKLGTH